MISRKLKPDGVCVCSKYWEIRSMKGPNIIQEYTLYTVFLFMQ